MPTRGRTWTSLLATSALIASGLTAALVPQIALAAGPAATPAVAAVPNAEGRTATLVGSLQTEFGCAGDWAPDCAETLMTETGPGVYVLEGTMPAGAFEYKVAIDGTWDEAYGLGGAGGPGAANIPLVLSGDTQLRFTFDDATKLVRIDVLGLDEGVTAEDETFVVPPARAADSENFYFVMTDRFANGDPTNDEGGLTGGPLVTGFDPTNKGFYQGGDIAGIIDQLDYIEGLGTTAIWLTPSFLNRAVQGEGANASAGYHGYWITDFTQIDPHLGTNDELGALIDSAHLRGIEVYFDIITNHTADVIDFAEGQYSYIDQDTDPYVDAGGNPFRVENVAGVTPFPVLDPATSFPYTPVIDPADATIKVPAVLNDPTKYHNRGNSTWSGESVTLGDFDGLDDLMTEDPEVVTAFIDVYKTWMDLGIDGFRIDTVKHVNPEFWEDWTAAIREHAIEIDPGFFMFGEVYDADASKTAPYVRDTDMDAVLDFSFQSAAVNYARGLSNATLRGLFASDDWYITEDSNALALPTFLGNHDMGRVGMMLRESGDPLARTELAYELMYLTRGQPVVYYGDEQGFIGAGGDKDARQTLFASQVATYNAETTLDGRAMSAVVDQFPTDAGLYPLIADLAELRASTPALTEGAQIERPVGDSETAYAFSRVARDAGIEHLAVLNNTASAATVPVTSLTPGGVFTGIYGFTGTVTADAAGAVSVEVPPMSAVLLVADRPVGAGLTGIDVVAPTPGAGVTGTVPVAATIDDVAAETSFRVRVVGDDQWTVLGTSESASPRVFHDVSSLPDGALLEYRAVAVDRAGTMAAGSTFVSVGNSVDGGLPPVNPELLVSAPGSWNATQGCPGDWQPDCDKIVLAPVGGDVYSATFTIPEGSYNFKIAIGGSWDINYGANGEPGGSDVPFTVTAETVQPVRFVYNHTTHQFTNTAISPMITAPGSYQEFVGCAGNWQPECLATWLSDMDGDGVFTYSTDQIPAGVYEVKVAHGLSWDESYGPPNNPGGNYTFSTTGVGKVVSFSYDIATHLLTIEVADPPLAGLGQLRAYWVDASTIAWPTSLVTGDPADLTWALHHSPDGSAEVSDGAVVGAMSEPLTLVAGGLTAAQVERFPALADYLALSVDPAQAAEIVKGELIVTQSSGETLSAATGVQIAGVLDDLYAAAAATTAFGPTWEAGVPSLGLWAPTALDVDLLLWTGDTAGAPQTVPMVRGADGSWTVTGEPGWEDAAYKFAVEVYVATEDEILVNEVTDPASLGLTLNSTHSVLVDLDDPRWAPQPWLDAASPVVRPVDQTIYELHVRDFSVSDETVPADLRGTYGAFAYEGDGRAHLRDLAEAGLTTVHLLPTFDIASIEEDRAAQLEPDCDLGSFAPDSEEQQACINPIRDQDAYNWGYDPLHWTTPEGSYAVEADGGTRTAEFRSMVGALHEDDLQIVLDQVFNHTSNSGQDAKSILDRVVPGYYHRLSDVGQIETSTCCQNIATENLMAERLMVDSVVTWARDYKVDGFRFDLMGHHSTANMQAVRDALDELTLAEDGVDGSAVYLYGEGWDFGEVAGNRLFEQAKQGQLDGTGIGTFSDRLRDAVRGGGPFDEDPRKQGFGSGLATDPNGAAVNGTEAEQLANLKHQTDLVRLGLAGNLRDYSFLASDGQVRTGAELDYNGQPAGYASSPEEIITYVDAHDNETLFDALTYKLPVDTSMADRVRMNTLSLATTALAQTPSFWHAGTDLLRSKSLDRDSYNSGDWFNLLDFSMQENGFARGLPPAWANSSKWGFQTPLLADAALVPAPEDITSATASAQDLLRLRFSTDLFRLGDAALIQEKVTFPGSGPDADPGVIVMHVDDTVGTDVDPALDGLLVVFNATPDPVEIALADLAGDQYQLSPVLAEGSDAVVKDTAWDQATGTVTVPARTVAALVAPQVTQSFTDVPVDHEFFADIEWLTANGIATGYADGTFGPARDVSRQAMAAFLYRLEHAGADAPDCVVAPFTDVPASHPFCGEIAWMVDEGITAGYADGTFGPARTVTRQAGAAFLYRLDHAGADAPDCVAAPLTDVPVSHAFCGEIAWMVDQEITNGYPDGTFGPARAVTRQATAAWLHRFATMPL